MKIMNRNGYFILVSLLILSASACTKKSAPVEMIANKPAGNAYGYGFTEVIRYTVYIGALAGNYSYLGTVPIEITNAINYNVLPILMSSTNHNGINVDLSSNSFHPTQNLIGEQITFVVRYLLLDGNFLDLTVVVGIGDFNFNCIVDSSDFIIIRRCFGYPEGSLERLRCDINFDGATNDLDLQIFIDHFNTRIPNCPQP